MSLMPFWISPVFILSLFLQNIESLLNTTNKNQPATLKTDSIKSCLCVEYSSTILDKLRLSIFIFFNGGCGSLTILKKKH